MTISKHTHRLKTFACRVALWSRVYSGMTEEDAVKDLWPIHTDRHGKRRNTSRFHTLQSWKRRGLWPLSPDEILEAQKWVLHKRVVSARNTVLLLDEITVEIASRQLSTIEGSHNEWPGGKMKKEKMIKTKIVGARIPTALIDQIEDLEGTKTGHLERAIRLYLEVIRARTNGND